MPNSQQAAFLGTKEFLLLLLGEPCSTLRGSLDGRRVGGRKDTCMKYVWLSPCAVHLKPSQHC